MLSENNKLEIKLSNWRKTFFFNFHFTWLINCILETCYYLITWRIVELVLNGIY